MYRIVRLLALAVAVIWVSGCASVPTHVKMDPGFWSDKRQTVVVAIAEMPAPDHFMLGQQGLLDVAINKGNAEELTAFLKTVDTSAYAKVTTDIAQALRAKGFKTQEHAGYLNVTSLPAFKAPESKDGAAKVAHAEKDFRELAKKYGPNRLLLLDVRSIGTQRNYFGFIPTSAPSATITVRGQIVDLADNRLLWRQNQSEQAAIADPWDQPQSFPNVGRAIEKVMLVSRKNMQKFFDETSVASATAGR